ncbi:MAG: hypothetical protein FWD39_02320 [Clostridiales bacterium]|nr:hypothetical protein [Clostridiales bacterium]
MKTSIYIANQSIMAATGVDNGRELCVLNCQRAELPGGLVRSGIITDAEAFAQQLKEFLKLHDFETGEKLKEFRNRGGDKKPVKVPRLPGLASRKIVLVLDNEGVTLKALDVPLMPNGKLQQVVRNEMGGHQDDENLLLYDYSVIKPGAEGSMGRVLAVSADREIVQGYKAAFAGAKLSLRRVDVAQNCASRLCRRLPDLVGRTFVFAALSDDEMLSMLFSEGECLIMNRTRLYETRGAAAAAVEISRGLSAMMQFNFTLNAEHPLSNVFLSGLEGEENYFLGEMVEALGVPVGQLPFPKEITGPYAHQKDSDFGEYLFCLGGLLE